MQSVDQTMNMSPMDLFDSIFWGMSDIDGNGFLANDYVEPYPAAGFDQIGFDYTQQIYPQF